MKLLRDLKTLSPHEQAVLLLRVGLGLTFLFGGAAKLSHLLDPSAQAAMVAEYLGPKGYINAFFADFLARFEVSTWGFLTGLSAFEVLSGVALIAGLAVRPLSLVFGLLFWTFVVSLPVVTAPGAHVEGPTYMAPALLVQIRDVALSGLMFVLHRLGPGRWSLDHRLFLAEPLRPGVSRDSIALLLRLSLASLFLVGGVFHGMDSIQSFSAGPVLLIVFGVTLASGYGARWVGLAAAAFFVTYLTLKFSPARSLLANGNGVKRELALLMASLALARVGGGALYRPLDRWIPKNFRFNDLRAETP